MDRQLSPGTYSSKTLEPKLEAVSSAELFDIVGNLPEDVLGEVISHLSTFEELQKLVTWQTVSRRWRRIFHDKSTRIYHQALLKCNVFRSLLPPTYYNNGNSGTVSRFSYETFRRAIRTHLAIKNGNLKARPDQYLGEGYGNGRVEAGPILADGFLVWLQKTSCYPGYRIILNIVDLTKRSPSGVPGGPGQESAKEVEVAEFTRGGPDGEFQFQRDGYSIEWLDMHTLNNMTWRALGCGGGLVAHWIAGDPSITVQDLAKPDSSPWKLPISGLKPETGKSQERYVNHLLCNKDFLVVNLSRSSTFGVYSTSSKALLHVLDISPEVPDSPYNVFTGMLSGWRDKNSCSLKIQDNYLIIACAMGMFFILEETTLRFKSWDLKSPPTYEELGVPSPYEIKCLRSNYDDDDDNEGDGPIVSKYPWLDFLVVQEEQEVDTSPCSVPNLYNRPKPPVRRPRDFLKPMTEVCLPLHLPHSGLYGPKLLFQPSNQIQLYCQDSRNPAHPTHPLKRWSYPAIPRTIKEVEENKCDDYLPVRRGYRRVLKEEGKTMDRIRKRFPTDVSIAGVRYELTLPPVPITSGGTSRTWADYKGWKEGKKCIRLQMRPETKLAGGGSKTEGDNTDGSTQTDGEHTCRGRQAGGEHTGRGGQTCEGAAKGKHWDVDVGIKVWRKHPHVGHGHAVSVIAGWEGVVVLWLDRVLVWRWDLEEPDESQNTKLDKKGGLVKRLKRKIIPFSFMNT